jgi:hypothetical protein
MQVQYRCPTDHRPAPAILFSGSRQPTLAAPWPRWVQRCVTPATADVAPNARVAHVRVALDLVARAARGSRYLVLSCLPPPIRRCGVHMSARRAGQVGTHATSAPRAVADGGFLVPHACARRSRWRAHLAIASRYPAIPCRLILIADRGGRRVAGPSAARRRLVSPRVFFSMLFPRAVRSLADSIRFCLTAAFACAQSSLFILHPVSLLHDCAMRSAC